MKGAKKVRLNIWVDSDTRDLFKAWCARRGRSISRVIREFMHDVPRLDTRAEKVRERERGKQG